MDTAVFSVAKPSRSKKSEQLLLERERTFLFPRPTSSESPWDFPSETLETTPLELLEAPVEEGPTTSRKVKKGIKKSQPQDTTTSLLELPEHQWHSFSHASISELNISIASDPKYTGFDGVLEVEAPDWFDEEKLPYCMGQGKYLRAGKRLLSARLWKPQGYFSKFLIIQVIQHKTLSKNVVFTSWGTSGSNSTPAVDIVIFEGHDAKEKAIEKFKNVFTFRTRGGDFDSPPETLNMTEYFVYTTASPKIKEIESVMNNDVILPIPLPGVTDILSPLSSNKDKESMLDIEAAAEAASISLFSPKTKKKPTKRLRDEEEIVKEEKKEEKKKEDKEKKEDDEKKKESVKQSTLIKEKAATNVKPSSLKKPKPSPSSSSSSSPLPPTTLVSSFTSSTSTLSSKAFALKLSLPKLDDQDVVFAKSSLPMSVTDLIINSVSNGALSELVTRLGVSARRLHLGEEQALLSLEKAAHALSDIASHVKSRNEFEFDELKSHEERFAVREMTKKQIIDSTNRFRSLIPHSSSNKAMVNVQVDLEKYPTSWSSLCLHTDEAKDIQNTTSLDSFDALSSSCRVLDLLKLLHNAAAAVLDIRRQQNIIFARQDAAGKKVKRLPNSADLLLQTNLSWIEPLNEIKSLATLEALVSPHHIDITGAFLCNLHSNPSFSSSSSSKLLWFTVPTCALPGILSTGIPSPLSDTPLSGYPFGKGVYLTSSPVAAYTAARLLEPTGPVHLYLVEVCEDSDTKTKTVTRRIHEDTSTVSIHIPGKQVNLNEEIRLREVKGVEEIESVNVSGVKEEEEEDVDETVCEFQHFCLKKELCRIRYLLVCNKKD
jgi:hypothetical protein